jgi:hypothetical protein
MHSHAFKNVVAPLFAKMRFRPKEGNVFLPPEFRRQKSFNFHGLGMKIFQIKEKPSILG